MYRRFAYAKFSGGVADGCPVFNDVFREPARPLLDVFPQLHHSHHDFLLKYMYTDRRLCDLTILNIS